MDLPSSSSADAFLTLVGALPNARHVTLAGQSHDVDPKVLAAALAQHLRR